METRRAATGTDDAGQAALWREAVIFDTGDAFADSPRLADERLENAVATAELIVDHYNAEGLDAQTLGDRDLALGRAALVRLKERARYPFVTTNLVDVKSSKPLFSEYVLIDVTRADKTVKLAVFGLMSERTAPTLREEGLAVAPPLEALRAAIAKAKGEGGEVFIVLSQLSKKDEAEIGTALPEVQLFLGGDFASMADGGEAAGKAISFGGGQKGKYVALLELTLEDPAGPGAPFIDPDRKAALLRKQADAERRLKNHERLVEIATAPPPEGETAKGPKRPIEVYQRQIVAARAELQLIADALAELGDDAGGGNKNAARLELVPLGKDIADEPEVKAKVDAFRKTWPDPTPGH